MRYSILLLTIPFSLAANRLQAQQADTAINKTQQLKEVEVRSVRAGTDAPFTKTEITKQYLDKQNLGQDLPVLLQYTPSAVSNSDAGTGVGYTGIHIRGVDPSRINITMNGIPVNDPEESATFFVDIPDVASSTSSIQIQRGVGTSTNGAGAFGATISLSNMQQFDTAGAILNTSYGSFNTLKTTLLAGTGMLKGGCQFDLRLSRISSDGYIQRSAADLRSLQFTAGWKASEKTWLHFMVMTGTEKTGQAWDGVPQDSLKTNRTYNELGLKSDGTFYNNQTDNYQQDYYQLFADHNFNSALTAHVGLFLTRGRGYYQEYQNAQSYADYGLAPVVTPNNDTISTTDLTRQLWLDNYYYGSVFSLMYHKHKTEITFGGAWTQFENQHYGIVNWAANGGIPVDYKWYNHASQKNDLNFYLKAQQHVSEKFILFGDVQYRNIAYNINGFQNHPDLFVAVNYNFFNPKVGATYLLHDTWDNKQKLYASLAVANKEPNHDDFEVDPANLPKPEQLYDVEAGYEINKQKWNAGANLYYMYYHNQLVLTGQINDVGAYTQTNVPTSYRAGLELHGAVAPLNWLVVHANLTLSQNKIKNFTEYIDDYDNGGQQAVSHGTTDIAFSPNVISALNLTLTPFRNVHGLRHLSVDINEKYVGRQYLDNTGNQYRSIDPYAFTNVIIHYGIAIHPFKAVEASLALNNIFSALYSNNGYTYSYIESGQTNTQNYFFPQAGFNVMGGLSFKW